MDKSSERVLVIPESQFVKAGLFRGFRRYDEAYAAMLLNRDNESFRSRGEVETDPTFKQLIPYVILRHRDEVFHYSRGSKGTETRLQSLRSIGIGGHINDTDVEVGGDLYRSGMLRELNEEVEIRSKYTESMLGFIYDDRTPVGSVHIGIVHVLDLEEPLAWPREDAIEESGFEKITELLKHRDEFETWSQFAMEQL